MTWLVIIVVFYLLLVNPHLLKGLGDGLASSVTHPAPAPPAEVLQWPPGPGQPGYVTINDIPAPAAYSFGSTGAAVTTLAGLQKGVVVAGSVVGLGSLAGGSAFGVVAAAGSAVPIIGAAVAAIGLVVGFIGRHHAEMVAKEAQELNEAVPAVIQRYVLIIQAAVHGDITDMSHAGQLIDEALADYYASVKPMLQGKWPWPFVKETGNLVPETKKPGTCNGPCIVGHYWIEPGALACYQGVWNVLQNKRGVQNIHEARTFGPIPSHAGFNGLGKVMVYF